MIASLLLLASAAQAPAPLLIRAKTLYTMAGAPVANGAVLIRDGKIAAVGANVSAPAGTRTIEAEVATPGFVDCRATVGLTGIFNSQGHDQDQLDRSGPVQPELRALDAYNPAEPLVAYLRGLGVTTALTGHAPGTLVSGTLSVVKLRGRTAEEAAVAPDWAVCATLGPGSLGANGGPGGGPGNRSRQLSMLRESLAGAKGAKADDGSLRKRMWARVIAREVPLVITAHKAQDIASALRLQREFGFRLILDGGAEAVRMIPEIKAAGIAVMLHPAMLRPEEDAEEASYATAARLKQAGIPFGFTSGFEGYVPKVRVVPFEAAVYAANGLGVDEALRVLTIGGATMLGLEGRIGSLEVGKDADLALFDGPPLEYTTHCRGSVIEGEFAEGSG